MSFRRLVV